ncbi:hypothetical protein AB395_00002739 [Sinorhizobium fredii CCBAU 45436]|nr:hypothetical protein AB395_00002739 [Sinorhizobium fredii CCBAU 45436]
MDGLQSHDRTSEGGLAAPALTYDTNRFPTEHIQGNGLRCLNEFASRREYRLPGGKGNIHICHRNDGLARFGLGSHGRSHPRVDEILGRRGVDDSKSFETDVRPRDSPDQRRRVGVLGKGENRARLPELDEFAMAHHCNPVCYFLDDRHIVGDKDYSGVVFCREPSDKAEYLGLDRNVECGRRLVGDQQIRVASQCDRDDDALPHATGKLVRILTQSRLGIRDADFLKQSDGFLSGLIFRHSGREPDRANELEADRLYRQQRAQRVLEDHSDTTTADLAKRSLVEAHEFPYPV